MDITQSTEPKSDQQNYDDYIGGSKTVTVSEVKRGSQEQPVEIHLVEFPGRPYKPAKSMRRVLLKAWGAEAAGWVGRRMTLYGDPTVRFGGEAVGGIRISHLSDIPEPLTIPLTVTRAKRAPFVVQPLDAAPARDWLAELALAGDDKDAVFSLGSAAKKARVPADILKAIHDRYKTLDVPQAFADTPLEDPR